MAHVRAKSCNAVDCCSGGEVLICYHASYMGNGGILYCKRKTNPGEKRRVYITSVPILFYSKDDMGDKNSVVVRKKNNFDGDYEEFHCHSFVTSEAATHFLSSRNDQIFIDGMYPRIKDSPHRSLKKSNEFLLDCGFFSPVFELCVNGNLRKDTYIVSSPEELCYRGPSDIPLNVYVMEDIMPLTTMDVCLIDYRNNLDQLDTYIDRLENKGIVCLLFDKYSQDPVGFVRDTIDLCRILNVGLECNPLYSQDNIGTSAFLCNMSKLHRENDSVFPLLEDDLKTEAKIVIKNSCGEYHNASVVDMRWCYLELACFYGIGSERICNFDDLPEDCSYIKTAIGDLVVENLDGFGSFATIIDGLRKHFSNLHFKPVLKHAGRVFIGQMKTKVAYGDSRLWNIIAAACAEIVTYAKFVANLCCIKTDAVTLYGKAKHRTKRLNKMLSLFAQYKVIPSLHGDYPMRPPPSFVLEKFYSVAIYSQAVGQHAFLMKNGGTFEVKCTLAPKGCEFYNCKQKFCNMVVERCYLLGHLLINIDKKEYRLINPRELERIFRRSASVWCFVTQWVYLTNVITKGDEIDVKFQDNAFTIMMDGDCACISHHSSHHSRAVIAIECIFKFLEILVNALFPLRVYTNKTSIVVPTNYELGTWGYEYTILDMQSYLDQIDTMFLHSVVCDKCKKSISHEDVFVGEEVKIVPPAWMLEDEVECEECGQTFWVLEMLAKEQYPLSPTCTACFTDTTEVELSRITMMQWKDDDNLKRLKRRGISLDCKIRLLHAECLPEETAKHWVFTRLDANNQTRWCSPDLSLPQLIGQFPVPLVFFGVICEQRPFDVLKNLSLFRKTFKKMEGYSLPIEHCYLTEGECVGDQQTHDLHLKMRMDAQNKQYHLVDFFNHKATIMALPKLFLKRGEIPRANTFTEIEYDTRCMHCCQVSVLVTVYECGCCICGFCNSDKKTCRAHQKNLVVKYHVNSMTESDSSSCYSRVDGFGNVRVLDSKYAVSPLVVSAIEHGVVQLKQTVGL